MKNKKTLILLRHAKSSWTDPELDDHERPLNGRGRRNAAQMGRLMKDQELVPELVLCSTSQRTRETAALFFAEWNATPSIEYRDDLYHAEPVRIESMINSIDDSIESLMIIGHNPGLEEFLTKHTGKALTMPTAALGQVDFELDSWRHFKEVTQGSVIFFWRPKEFSN
jgi:phosphohistidine phosphatase